MDDEPRCTLTANTTCLCTYRDGCPTRELDEDGEWDCRCGDICTCDDEEEG